MPRLRNLIARLPIWFLTMMNMGAAVQATDCNSTDNNPLTEDFARFAKETLHKWKVPGLSIAVIDGDQIFAEGYGFATLPDTPATPETLWYGASTTKAQTAATLALLIDSKEHPALANGWSTTISSIIHDDFVLQDEWATEHITLDDAVSHRTGMARHDKSSARVIDGKEVKPKDVVRNLRNLPLTTEPRLHFYYTNLMYITLSHVIEIVTGKWLGDVMKELIWAPLDMNSTFFDLQDAMDAPEHLASGYYWDKKEGIYKEVPFMAVTDSSGAGAVFSNVLDYSKWVKCLLHEAPPFSKDVHKDIKAPRMLVSTQPDAPTDINIYGLGWQRTLYKGHVVYTHAGGMHAYGAQVYWLPEAKYGVVAFANTATTSNAAEEVLAWKLIEDQLAIPENDRFDFDAKYQKMMNGLLGINADESVNILYPKRPNPPLPASMNTTELQGIYYDPGYGRITLREVPHPSKPGEKILVADRPEMTWKYQMKLHHVSGDYWIVYLPALENPGYFTEFMAGDFKIGVDGKAAGLLVDWVSRFDNMVEGKVLFKRVDQV